MTTQALNLFIVEDNHFPTKSLSHYLRRKFGKKLKISTYFNDESALREVNKDTNIVILDYNKKNGNGIEVLESIKKINPATEVIMLSSNEEIEIAIDAYCKGAIDYVINDKTAWQKIGAIVAKIMMYPVHVLVKEFGVSKFVAIFLINFILVGIVSFVVLRFII